MNNEVNEIKSLKAEPLNENPNQTKKDITLTQTETETPQTKQKITLSAQPNSEKLVEEICTVNDTVNVVNNSSEGIVSSIVFESEDGFHASKFHPKFVKVRKKSI